MSQADVKRFIADLKAKPQLLAGLKQNAAGLASVVAFATANGYAITAADARDYIRGLTLQNLSDAHLDHLAGGKGGAPTSTGQAAAAVQASGVVTTATSVNQVTMGAVVNVNTYAVTAVVLT